MKALTVWQPWTTLIVEGGKPYEFRHWNYASRFASLVDQRIAIHAGSRAMRLDEVKDIIERVDDGLSALVTEIARPILDKILAAHSALRQSILPHSAVIGTAIIRRPEKPYDLFKHKVSDSDRYDHTIWAWPLTDIVRFDEPIHYRGAQGFWNFPDGLLP